MKSWIGLLKKEFYLSKTNVLIALVGLLVAIIASFIIAQKMDEPAVMFGISLVILGLHIFNLAIYMLNSLQVESRQMHLWLHNPQPAAKLLIAKLANGFGAFLLSLSVSILFAIYAGNQSLDYYDIVILDWSAVSQVMGTIIFYLVNIAIHFAIWVIFYWAIHQVIKGYIGKFSIVLTILLFFFVQWGFAWITETKLYYLITGWGKMPVRFEQSTFLSMFSVPPDVINGEIQLLFFGEYLFYVLLSIGLFFLSCWLIDRKVEVR